MFVLLFCVDDAGESLADAVGLRREPELQGLGVALEGQMDPVSTAAKGQGVVVGAEDGNQVAPAPAALLSFANVEGIATDLNRGP